MSFSATNKARDLIAAIRILKSGVPPTEYEVDILRAFPGFGCVALQVFPDPVTGMFKKGWDDISGTELRGLLTDEEYASARRTVFNAFYTSPVVMNAIYAAFKRLGVPDDARVLEPGCGCIQGDAIVTIRRGNSNTKRLSLKALNERQNGLSRRSQYNFDPAITTTVLANNNGYIQHHTLKRIWCSGVKQTYTLSTASGRSIRATKEHPFLTDSGWKKLGDIAVGERCLVQGPRSFGIKPAKPEYTRIFGMQAHPFANRYKNGSAMVPQHRLVVEAAINDMAYDDFLDRLGRPRGELPGLKNLRGVYQAKVSSANIDGLKFLDPAIWAVHHKDRNPKNNTYENLALLTHREHRLEHELDSCLSCFYHAVFDEIVSIEPFGQETTYDIEMAAEPHNFVSNGFVVHNSGGFISTAPEAFRFVGIELDRVSGGIAQLIHPEHDIRIESFADTRLSGIDAVVGNVPFADISLDHNGQKLSLHDYFIAKSLDILSPGGVIGLVTSRYTLDKLDSTARELFQRQADLIGAIRLPNETFRDQGTSVVTDILFLRKRMSGEAELAFDWRDLDAVEAEGKTAQVNAYFIANPDMVLGTPVIGHGQYGQETLSYREHPDFGSRLARAILSLQPNVFTATPRPTATFRPAPVGRPEGSFYIEGTGIFQVECGVAEPVMFGQTHLTADGGLMGRRLAALIGLRDDARAVLKAQNEGLDPAERERTRRALNRSYDRFLSNYGPINKTTFGKTKDGSDVRRMPNLAKFREDPDAFLVMSLEVYDEATGKAEKAPIMLRDVVGPTQSVTSVQTAEEGLLVSLNERGRVDIPHISALYGKDEARIVAELGELLFHNPDSGEYQTKDAYLSGNVRRRLAAAQASTDPRHRRNVAALLEVQPVDLLPGEIDANLGAPWIPALYIREFAADLLEVERSSVTVDHFPKDAVWVVKGDSKATGSVQNSSQFGTGRADGLTLLDQALNCRSPAIYDEIKTLEGSSRVLNQTETFAAKEKQRQIKERFASWIFTDHDRAEHLVQIYNDTFNNLRLQDFDGSHLSFPGMAQTFDPRKHQKDVVWRIVSSGNTLMAHAVGAGKTGAMAMAAMKLRQTGLVRKSMIAIPNHMLEQFGREFLQIYPNAKLLIAGKEDLARDRRKLLTAKIATGEWDAIIVTHSSFERIGMSKAFQEQYLGREIDAYSALLLDARGTDTPRNILKHIEKRKAGYEEKLKLLLADRKKDDGLVFDELGVDQIFIDESHYFKNMEIATKMDRVAGIQTTGSQRAFDLNMKCQFLEGKHSGRGIAFATGTPISNSMVEMYTIKRYLASRMLEERGIEHFDAWAASFGKIVESMEISPDGASLRPRARFSEFVNLPELQQMFRSFADVQTADMLKLPVPRLRGGKAQIVACPMSPDQQIIQAGLVKRYERIRQGGVNPKDDNALAITTDGRKLALDVRLIEPAEAWDDSKTVALIDNTFAIWQRTAGTRGSQLIFSDIGVNRTEWGFSVYEDIMRALVARGVPSEQIVNIGDANTDPKKAALFAQVRAGRVRILLGSTAKMGTGTNVQKRLCALHHVDAPWKPAEIEQRDGRILRQGNDNEEVEIFRYVTEGSFDAYMWQALENKARFIAQIMRGGIGVRRASDIGGAELSFAEVKAIASGNPAVLTLAEMDADLQRLTLLRRSHSDEQFRIRSQVRSLPYDIERLHERAAALKADHAMALADDTITVGTRTLDREDAIEAMNLMLKNHLGHLGREARTWPVGSYRGFKLTLRAQEDFVPELLVGGRITHEIDFRSIAAGRLLNQIDALVEGMPIKADMATEQRKTKETQLEGFNRLRKFITRSGCDLIQ